jgi:hypothetical protein
MITRKQYLADSAALYHPYYLQFADRKLRSRVMGAFGPEELARSTDPHFNDIPLARWDDLARSSHPFMPHERLVAAGDFYSLSCGVCLLKAIARDIKQNLPEAAQ